MVSEARPDLQDLCASELLEVYVTLHDLYQALGDSNKAGDVSKKAKELLSSPALLISEEQRNTITPTLN